MRCIRPRLERALHACEDAVARDNARTWSGYADLFAVWQSSGQAARIREKLGMVASMVPDSVRLLFHCLGNEDSGTARRFRRITGGWDSDLGGTRHVPPLPLRNDEDAQPLLFEQIADPFMGSDFRKGRPYTWLANHLMDGNAEFSPRSFLQALLTAARSTRTAYRGHDRGLPGRGRM